MRKSEAKLSGSSQRFLSWIVKLGKKPRSTVNGLIQNSLTLSTTWSGLMDVLLRLTVVLFHLRNLDASPTPYSSDPSSNIKMLLLSYALWSRTSAATLPDNPPHWLKSRSRMLLISSRCTATSSTKRLCNNSQNSPLSKQVVELNSMPKEKRSNSMEPRGLLLVVIVNKVTTLVNKYITSFWILKNNSGNHSKSWKKTKSPLPITWLTGLAIQSLRRSP